MIYSVITRNIDTGEIEAVRASYHSLSIAIRHLKRITMSDYPDEGRWYKKSRQELLVFGDDNIDEQFEVDGEITAKIYKLKGRS